MSGFQIIVTSAFVGFIVLGMAVFSIFGGAFGGAAAGPVVIWGTQDAPLMTQFLQTQRSTDGAFSDVTYLQKDPDTYTKELINAMAGGTGPDLVLLSHDQLGAFEDKLGLIPYGAVSQSAYTSAYIDEGRLFLTSSGILALPLFVDPLVMYWNRDLFGSAGVAQPPQYWNDFLALAPKMTSLDKSQNVRRSAVALGQWDNVLHAQEILSTLFLQAGESISTRGSDGRLVSTLGKTGVAGQASPAESALRFYTEFSNPSKTTYSWNRSLPQSDEAFVAGQLAVYFGFASEYRALTERNPNLRIGVAMVPQLESLPTKTTYGKLTGVAVPRGTRNPSRALEVAVKMTSQPAIAALAQGVALPPVRLDVALNTSANAAAEVFVQSALVARGWLGPDPKESEAVFKTMVESVLSGRSQPGQAVFDASNDFSNLFK